MASQILPPSVVKRVLRKGLGDEVGWQSYAGIIDESKLYNPPDRTSPNQVPAHFGFEKGSPTISNLTKRIARELLGDGILGEREPLDQRDFEILTFGPFAEIFHSRLKSVVKGSIWSIVAIAIAQMFNRRPDDVQTSEPSPKWEGPLALTKFIGLLVTALEKQVTNLPKPVISPSVENKIKAAEKLLDIRDVILEEVVSGSLERRIKDIEKSEDD
jgi:hypothetical protein